MGDHPPITPMRANEGELEGEQARLYDLVTRHFIATVSPDCVYEKTKATFECGGETFTLSGKVGRALWAVFPLVCDRRWRVSAN